MRTPEDSGTTVTTSSGTSASIPVAPAIDAEAGATEAVDAMAVDAMAAAGIAMGTAKEPTTTAHASRDLVILMSGGGRGTLPRPV